METIVFIFSSQDGRQALNTRGMQSILQHVISYKQEETDKKETQGKYKY